MMIATAFVITGTTPHAQSQSVIDHPVQGANSAPPSLQTHTLSDSDHKKLFLKTIKQLATQSPISEEKVFSTFGWPTTKKQSWADMEISNTYYDPSPLGKPNNASYGTAKNKREFYVQLDQQQMCVRSEDILSEFGKTFKPILANVEGWPDENTLSEAVKKNIKLFFWGAVYQFNVPSGKTNLSFEFGFSECLNHISITEITQQGAQQ